MRIVIFGAGGCVGGWICEELSLRADVDVVACVRNWASAVRPARRGLDIRRADLGDTHDLPGVLSGADVVINATMPLPSREPELVTGLYRACVEAGVRRFVQFSSAAVYGNLTGDLDEKTNPSPVDDYSRGKAEMERRLTEAAKGSATQAIILRPSIIYGPFSEAWTVRYVDRISKGRWRGLGSAGTGICNLIHAQDVARAAIAAATGNITPGVHVLNIGGPDVVTWNEYIERLGNAMGTPDRVTPSAAGFRLMAATAELLRKGGGMNWVKSFYRKSTGGTRTAMTSAKGVTQLYPTSGELNLLGRKVKYLANHASHVLGFRPSVSLNEGLEQSVAWCRMHGVV